MHSSVFWCRVGDGDCGSTLAKGASAIQADCASCYPLNAAPACLAAIAESVRRSMGGTSGALYELLFAAAAGVCLLCCSYPLLNTPPTLLHAYTKLTMCYHDYFASSMRRAKLNRCHARINDPCCMLGDRLLVQQGWQHCMYRQYCGVSSGNEPMMEAA